MKTLTLLFVLVAGVAGAQPATTNCRSSAFVCNSSTFESFATTGPAFRGRVGAAQYVLMNGTAWGIWTNSGDLTMNFTVGNLTAMSINAAGQVFQYTQNWPVQNTGSASPSFSARYGVTFAAGADTTWSSTPISNNTIATSQVVYNSSAQELAFNNVRAYTPLGSGRDWVLEKRELRADLGYENANCPIGAPSIRSTGAGAVTFACTDAAAATTTTLEFETFRMSTTAAAGASVSLVDVSANVTKLELGPKYKQRVMVPSGSDAAVRLWLALVPTATSLSGVDTGAINVIGFRYSTAVPDTSWQACTGNGAAVTCVSTGVSVSIAHRATFEIDCRETTACRFLINGSLVASQTTPANMPGTTTQLAPRLLVQTTNATAKAFGYGRAALETN